MVKCKECGHEIPDKVKTLKIKGSEIGLDYDIEVEKEVTQKGTKFEDLVIPKGWRLLNYDEVIKLANSKYAKELKMDGNSDKDDFFIEQPFDFNKKNNYVAWFWADSNWVSLICGTFHTNSNSSLGVRFCREVK
jgi:hypothetical protein